MSSWAAFRIGSVTVESWQNSYDPGFFNDADRVREVQQSNSPPDYEFYDERDFIGYRTSAARLRRRMALHGYDQASLARHFDASLKELTEAIRVSILLYKPERQDELSYRLLKRASEALPSSTLDEWLSRIPKAIALTDSMSFEDVFNLHEYVIEDDPLLSVMLSSLPFFSDYSITAKWHFPCVDPSFFTLALLEVSDDETICELDITELVYGERADDFSDLDELQQGHTSPFRNFSQSLDELSTLSSLKPSDPVLQRMCFSSIITAMEAYLSDIMKREVLNNEAIKRRFVEKYSKFEKERVYVPQLYQFLENLDKRIEAELDGTSFHNIQTALNMYRDVLLIEFPKASVPALHRAVEKRHDIVHRNGKTTDGLPLEVAYEHVSELMVSVRHFLLDIDRQVMDGMINYDQEDA